jgi:hypothetical protein
MALPDATITVLDGQLGLVPASVANAHAKIGVCSDGIVGTVYSANDNGTAQTLLGQGPLVDAMSHTLTVAGGPVYALPINPSAVGTASAVVRGIAVGAGVLTVTLAPKVSIAIKITTGGANGTGTFAISLGGASYGANVATTGGSFAYAIPGTLTTITLAAAQTWVLNDIYTIATDGTVSLAGTGPAASNVTHADSPLDAYNVLITTVTTGAPGTGVFTWSWDGGNSTSGQVLIPSSGKYAIPSTGVVLNFSGTFTAGDTYTFTTTSAGYSNSDITTALTTLNNSAVEFGFVHIVGMGANSAAAAATAAVIQTAMVSAFTGYRFIRAVMECPTNGSGASTEADSVVAAAFGSVSADRVSVCAGDAALSSPLTGRIQRRNLAWVYTARLALIQPGESPAFVGRGALPAVVSIYRDELKTPLLDASRFVTLRTHRGTPGYYITRGMMMAPAGSDFSKIERCRVMDVACRIARAAELPFVNGSVRINKDGTINEKDAQNFEGIINSKLKAGVVNTGDASSSTVVMNRSANILSTGIAPVSVRIVPLGYLEIIQTSIGFNNPALVF